MANESKINPVAGDIEPSIPLPPKTEQTQATEAPSTSLQIVTPTEQRTGLEQYPMTEAVKAAAEAGAFRSASAQFLLQGLSKLREADLKSAREERQAAQAAADIHRDNYHDEHVKRAVLEERVRCGGRTRRLQNILVSLGGILFGVGLQPILTTFSIPYFILAVIGLVMLVVGWREPKASEDGQ